MPGLVAAIDGARNDLTSLNWELCARMYNGYGFRAVDEHARFRQQPGPVLVIEPPVDGAVILNTKSLATLRTLSVDTGLSFHTCSLSTIDELARHIRRVCAVADQPDAQPWPRSLVIALKIVDKLGSKNRWGGDNESQHLRRDLLPRGGFEKEEQPFVLNVEQLLRNKGILKYKAGDGTEKIWLNPERRTEICDAVRQKRFSNVSVQQSLTKDRNQLVPIWMPRFGHWA